MWDGMSRDGSVCTLTGGKHGCKNPPMKIVCFHSGIQTNDPQTRKLLGPKTMDPQPLENCGKCCPETIDVRAATWFRSTMPGERCELVNMETQLQQDIM